MLVGGGHRQTRVLPGMMLPTSWPFISNVRLTDRIGLVVQLLAKHGQTGIRIQVGKVLTRHRQHAARTGRGIVDGSHHPRLGQHLVIFDEQQVDHQANNLTRGEMLPGGFVGDLGKLADQLLEDQSIWPVA
jgi:hypothetical protein